MSKKPHTPWSVRLFVAVMFGLAGCTTISLLLVVEPSAASGGEVPAFYICASLGAVAGGLLFATFMGRDQRRAWLLGCFGAVFGTLVGAGLGGLGLGITAGLGLIENWSNAFPSLYASFIMTLQLGFAAMVIVFVSMFFTLAGPVWLGLMIVTQLGARYLRRLYPEPIQTSAFD